MENNFQLFSDTLCFLNSISFVLSLSLLKNFSKTFHKLYKCFFVRHLFLFLPLLYFFVDDEGFEMVQNNMYANPLADLEKAKAEAARGEARNKQLLEENKAKDKQTMEMMQQMKRLKQGNQRNLAAIKGHNHKSRTPRLRKEMAQQRVKSDV